MFRLLSPQARRALGAVLVGGLYSVSAPSWAADAATDALLSAYGPYRAALFRTNGTDAAAAVQALQQAQSAMQSVQQRFAAAPPAPYDRDSAFASSLQAVQTLYRKAADEVQAGRLPAAHETLESVRDELSALRRRNQVIVYSDHMNAYHETMEHVLVQGPQWLDRPAGLWDLALQVGALELLAQRLRTQAPATHSADAEFEPLLKGVEASVAALKTAVLRQDVAAARLALGQVKTPYSKLFLKFG